MITYRGWRDTDGEVFVFVYENDKGAKELPPRTDLRNHSPTGFEWGYGGSGPAQLALALCAHALSDDELAMQVYQPFKWAAVARLPRDASWAMTEHEVRAVVEGIRASVADRA